jgi:hypothetical protein
MARRPRESIRLGEAAAVRKPRTQKKNVGAFGGIELKINQPGWQSRAGSFCGTDVS